MKVCSTSETSRPAYSRNLHSRLIAYVDFCSLLPGCPIQRFLLCTSIYTNVTLLFYYYQFTVASALASHRYLPRNTTHVITTVMHRLSRARPLPVGLPPGRAESLLSEQLRTFLQRCSSVLMSFSSVCYNCDQLGLAVCLPPSKGDRASIAIIRAIFALSH